MTNNDHERQARAGTLRMTQEAEQQTVRVAAMADIHVGKDSAGALQTLFAHVSANADVLVLAGDLTDYGLPDEARILARELNASVRIPVIAVLGNHDFESGRQEEVVEVLHEGGVRILDGDSVEILGVGFAGTKGFAGGFGRGALGPWGEPIIKQFVHEAVNEALKLETALARLRTPSRIAILHYAPIRGTVEGEPLEIFPYLGCSRLEEPLSRYPVTAVVHGHAHRGAAEGTTATGVPVYNVSLPVVRALQPDGHCFRIIEVPVHGPDGAGSNKPAQAVGSADALGA